MYSMGCIVQEKALVLKVICMINKLFFIVLQVLNWKLVDFELAIGLCTIQPKAEVLAILWRIITSAWQNYAKITVTWKCH